MRSDITAQLAEPSFSDRASHHRGDCAGGRMGRARRLYPGTARWKLWLPVAPLSVWIASLGHQCWSEWILVGASGMSLRPDWMCLPNIAVIGALPAIAIVIAIRRGARLDATPVLWEASRPRRSPMRRYA
ncbi:DUF1109 family protein (plasmid) [Burkholderia glumae]|uniref:NrsF family protein n=1 Tax=Burkholderia glumae TaxID=337 RepID=UPI001903D081|nr:NrsF family protein [Burkholderia glumae]QQM94977.1 DUF1109 family protein [Burkholderia glumae]